MRPMRRAVSVQYAGVQGDVAGRHEPASRGGCRGLALSLVSGTSSVQKQAHVKFSPKCLERGVSPFGTAPCGCYCGRLSFGQLDKVHLTGRHEVATRLRQSRVPKLLAISKPEPLKPSPTEKERRNCQYFAANRQRVF